jgi:tripartite-type tricarboxylate transporter receptor subunit TctC
MSTRREMLQATLGASALLAGLRPAAAQSVDQVKIYYGFPAGSGGDSVARRVGEKLAGSVYTKSPAVVENRPGAGGRIALDLLKSSPSDGSVLALTPQGCATIYPHIYTRLSYDPVRDIVPVSTAAIMDFGLAVGPMAPANVKTVKDLLAWFKASPLQASYGSPGAGTAPHFIGALLGMNNGLDMKHVPYRGSVPGITDLVGGQLAAMLTPSGDFIPNHKAGKLRLLATSGKQRSPFAPEVPTFAEQGFPEFVMEEWFGFYAPAKTPSLLVERANQAINRALKEKSVVDSLAVVGLQARGSTPQAMAQSQKAEYERWAPLVKRVGFTADS